MKQCTLCKEVKDESEFYKDRTTKSGLYPQCKSCRKQANRNRWKNNKERLTEQYQANKLKRFDLVQSLKTPCQKCGEDRLYLIQFHHINPSDKLFDIQQINSHGLESIKNEAKKCVCLCANCHYEFHWFYGRHPYNPKEAIEEYLL